MLTPDLREFKLTYYDENGNAFKVRRVHHGYYSILIDTKIGLTEPISLSELRKKYRADKNNNRAFMKENFRIKRLA